MVATAATLSAAPPRAREHVFYFGFIALLTALIVAGFTPSFVKPLVRGELAVPGLVRVHGFVFFGWLALVMAQISLVASGNIRMHRRLGAFGAALAAVMLVLGWTVALGALARDIGLGKGDAAKAFLLTPLLDMLMFVTLVGVALAYRRRTDIHKRLMLLATLGLAGAGTFRLLLPFDESGWLALVLTDGLVVLPLLFDKRAYGRVHPAYWTGAATIVAVHLTEMTMGTSAAWLAVAEWIAARML